jgi:ketosteroid isomerase-like protein
MTLPPLVARLIEAANAHDLDAMTDCFAPDFVNETPAHPERNFRGRDHVRRNWSQIFRAVPNIRTDALRCTVDAEGSLWVEWDFNGTFVDGAPHRTRGVSIFGVEQDRFAWVRFYLEPVRADGITADSAVQHVMEHSRP